METDEQPVRLDVAVQRRQLDLSRARVQKLIKDGKVSLNGQIQTKAAAKVRSDDTLLVDDVTEAEAPSTIHPRILYEDDDCVVINKPAGVLTHSKGAFNPEPTVASWLSSRTTRLSGERAGIVHRLDRATSGVMICAKTPEALSWLQKQFSQRKVKKTYIAVIEGELSKHQAIIDMPIERNPRRPQTFRVGQRGKPAVTAYKTLQTNGERSLLELRPTTGRTHQLRVHLKHLHHPILGDKLYGGMSADRLFLHAKTLELTLPNRRRQTFEAPLPPEFKERLR